MKVSTLFAAIVIAVASYFTVTTLQPIVIADEVSGVVKVFSYLNDAETKKTTTIKTGTAFFIEKNLLATAAHVVDDANSFKITTKNNPEQYTVTIKFKDDVLDIALLEINDFDKFSSENKYSVLSMLSSNYLNYLSPVYAIGHPLGMNYTVTSGHVNALHRKKNDITPVSWIQSDVFINPGSSGGPLINWYGYVVGMSTVEVLDGAIALAVPSDQIIKSVNTYKNKLSEKENFFLKFLMKFVNKNNYVMVDIIDDGFFTKVGLKRGDIVEAISTQSIGITIKVYSLAELIDAVVPLNPGEELTMFIKRDKEQFKLRFVVPKENFI